MKDELVRKIMTEFAALRVQMYAYRKLDWLAAQDKHKKLENKCCKDIEKCVVAKSHIFDDYKTCLCKGKTINRH